MVPEWEATRLGDVAELITGFPFKSHHYVEDPSAPRLLRGDNVVQGALRWDGVKRWPASRTQDLRQYELRDGDVVLAMDRPWIDAGLKYASVRASDLPALLVQRVARLRGTARLHTSFLKYVIGSQNFTDYILAVQTGTAVPHISGGQIKNFEFPLPPLSEQRAIAHILGALDEKIELNRKVSETLEAMARALFKSWFVDCDPVRAKMEGRNAGLPREIADLLPDRMVESELGEIPEGWEVKALDEIARFLNGLALQKYPPSGDRSLPVIKIAQLRAGNILNADRASADVEPAYIVNDGDILFSWSGSLECTLWAGGKGALNQHLFKVTSQDCPRWLCYLGVHQHLENFRRIAAGKATTMGHIQRHHLSDAKLAVPPRRLMRAANDFFEPAIEAIWRRRVESRTVAHLRDSLLPKLISGELRIKDANRYAVEVA